MISIRTSQDKERFGIFCPESYYKIAKTIPGYKWNPDAKAWVYSASPTMALLIRNTLSNIPSKCDEAFNIFLKTGEEAYAAAKRAQQMPVDSLSLPPIYKEDRPLWKHQRRAFWYAVSLWGGMENSHGGGVCLNMRMGTGKSSVAIHLIANYRFEKTIIIAPSKILDVWDQQFQEHDPLGCRVLILKDGSVKRRAQQAIDHLELCKEVYTGQPSVIVVNYEAARQGDLAAFILRNTWDCAISEESHRIKEPTGITSKFVGLLGRKSKHRLALTGTLLPHSPLDVFAQWRFLDPSIFGTSWTKFRSKYAILGGFNGYQVTGYLRLDELQQKIYSIAYRVNPEEDSTKRDAPIQVYRKSKLNKGKNIYWNMYNHMVTEVKGGIVSAGNALTKLLRLQQITGGHLKDEEGVQHYDIDTAKAELLADVLLDLPIHEPLVIFCRFHPDMDICTRACEASGRTVSELSGRLDTKQEWIDGKTDVLIAQIASGKEGISLVRASYTIYYSLGFSLGDFDQSVSRTDRPGQKADQVTCIHLLMEGTVDEQIYKAIQDRRDIIKSVLEDMES